MADIVPVAQLAPLEFGEEQVELIADRDLRKAVAVLHPHQNAALVRLRMHRLDGPKQRSQMGWCFRRPLALQLLEAARECGGFAPLLFVQLEEILHPALHVDDAEMKNDQARPEVAGRLDGPDAVLDGEFALLLVEGGRIEKRRDVVMPFVAGRGRTIVVQTEHGEFAAAQPRHHLPQGFPADPVVDLQTAEAAGAQSVEQLVALMDHARQPGGGETAVFTRHQLTP